MNINIASAENFICLLKNLSWTSDSIIVTDSNDYGPTWMPCFFRIFLLGSIMLCTFFFWRDKSRKLNLPPGSNGWPVIGETIPFVINGRTYFQERIKKYGLIFRSHLVMCPTIVVCGSENVRTILHSEGQLVSASPMPASMALFGNSLSNLSGPLHTMRHNSVRNLFNHSSLTKFTSMITSGIHAQILKWHTENKIMAVHESKRLMLELGAEILVGLKLQHSDTNIFLKEFENFSNNFFSLPIDVKYSGFWRAKQAKAKIDKIIKERVMCKHECMFTPLYEELSDTSIVDLCDTVLEILFGLVSTTSSALCFLIKTLAEHPSIVADVCTEVKEFTMQEQLDHHNELSFRDISSRLPLVNAVVKEILRLTPPIAGGFRKAITDFELGGYVIPAGFGILYCITDTHEQAPDYTATFSPTKWIKAHKNTGTPTDTVTNTSRTSRYDYIPFSAGPRTCPGKEFANLVLRIATIQLCMTSTWRLDNAKARIKTSPIPFPADGMPMEIKPKV